MKAHSGFPGIVPIVRIPGAWKTFAQRPESSNGPSPCIADEQSSEAKR
ncbi:hypothetical protein GPL06_06315 [Bacteroides salyersiae]|nr:hypothetical protein [Bacteroides salyersiae]